MGLMQGKFSRTLHKGFKSCYSREKSFRGWILVKNSYSDFIGNFLTPYGHAKQVLSFERVKETQAIATERLGHVMLALQRHSEVGLKIGKPKNEQRAREKALTDYEGDLSLVCDMARGKLIVENPDQVIALQAMLSDPNSDFMRRHGLFVVQSNDYFARPKEPTGYSCLNYKIAVPVGEDKAGKTEYQVCELQVVAKQIEEISKSTHRYKRAAEHILVNAGEHPLPQDLALASANFAAAWLLTAQVRRNAGYEKLLENKTKLALTPNREHNLKMRIAAIETIEAEALLINLLGNNPQLLDDDPQGSQYIYGVLRPSHADPQFYRYDLKNTTVQRFWKDDGWKDDGRGIASLTHNKHFTEFPDKKTFGQAWLDFYQKCSRPDGPGLGGLTHD